MVAVHYLMLYFSQVVLIFRTLSAANFEAALKRMKRLVASGKRVVCR